MEIRSLEMGSQKLQCIINEESAAIRRGWNTSKNEMKGLFDQIINQSENEFTKKGTVTPGRTNWTEGNIPKDARWS